MARRLADAPAAGSANWRDASAPLATRVRSLLDQLTTEEKIAQLDATTHPTGGVDRLGVPAFQGWNGAFRQEHTRSSFAGPTTTGAHLPNSTNGRLHETSQSK